MTAGTRGGCTGARGKHGQRHKAAEMAAVPSGCVGGGARAEEARGAAELLVVAACDEEMREAAGSNGSMGTTTKGHRHEEEARLDCSGSRAAKYEVVGVGLGAQQGRRLLLGEEVEAGGARVDLSHGEGGRRASEQGEAVVLAMAPVHGDGRA